MSDKKSYTIWTMPKESWTDIPSDIEQAQPLSEEVINEIKRHISESKSKFKSRVRPFQTNISDKTLNCLLK